jgi:hypothetical protein
MESAADSSQAFARYARLIRRSLDAAGPFVATRESATAIQVERGIVLAHVLRTPNRRLGAEQLEPLEALIECASSPKLARIAVVDAAGNDNTVYRPLLVYSWLVSFSLLYETLPRREHGRWEEALRAWCDLLESDLGQAIWTGDGIPARSAPAAAEATWTALALHVAGKVFGRDVWLDLASDLFGKLTRSQQADGSFIAQNVHDEAEQGQGEYEPVILHAAADYALAAKDRIVAATVARGAHNMLANAAPDADLGDHALRQPWALFAYIWNPPTRPLADRWLADSASSGISPSGLMLLADAIYSLAAFGAA